MSSLALESALKLASHGMAVFPIQGIAYVGKTAMCTCRRPDCPSPGKHPITKGWQLAATKDKKTIEILWRRYPWANVGVLTGAVSSIVVLDIDPRHGGDESLEDAETENGKLPETPTVLTGGLGRHLYFRHPGGIIKNSASGIARGLDIRADGGYVVGPGSTHESGRTYQWEASSELGDLPLATLPVWLNVRAQEALNAMITASNGTINEGTRNVFLTSVAGYLRRFGASRDSLAAILSTVNERMCSPPLAAVEVEGIAKSVAKYAPFIPRNGETK